jgi:hypothetical protein
MNASTPVFQTIRPLTAPSATPVKSARIQETGITQSPIASMKTGQVMLSSITIAASA